MSHSIKITSGALQQRSLLAFFFEKSVTLTLVLSLTPVYLTNILIALCKGQSILTEQHKIDALGRKVVLRYFSAGLWQSSVQLLQVLKGELALCGATCTHRLSHDTLHHLNEKALPSALISLHDLHLCSGLSVTSPDRLYTEQARMSAGAKISLTMRYAFNSVFYKNHQLVSPARLHLFGLDINNTNMNKAIDWFTQGTFFRGIKRSSLNLVRPKISFFVNANSVNLAQRDPEFKATLKKADCLFGDGSGIRLAAKSRQLQLLDNINGTDVLPLLCKSLQKNQKSLFLLGAKPGVAEKMAENIKQYWPDLRISGVQHGYFAKTQNQDVIAHINSSNTDVLLVAQGSPLQESWVIENAAALQCESVLAVGGLFDFFSGNITRAPMWMRETGLEWIWRLLQEPATKFKRYVIGVPEFMFRTFVLKQANQE